ncbi:5-oxoprolinase subunit B/C family protein [Spelaeicoccus albus]|uniref:KipI family sensor histidine kinase inhibitor n=1 Tax=Spelaeicoccus albus TaxID=1280376 RepID=A0A7Z0IH79_9MICO|nr:urea amidolyase family protein [Spelaeicoccus albus]NYI67549.1 KipI family sensor histidine kinase inhibitor [Spelaeicoccus albus]
MITGVHAAGPTAWLIEMDSLDDVVRLHAQLTAAPLPGQQEVLPAARTLLVRCGTRQSARRAETGIADLRLSEATDRQSAPPDGRKSVDIDVVYDGDDLRDVADRTGLSVEALVDAHTGKDWVGAFGGFAPGFTYLAGGDSRLVVPRRDSPRTSVPAGAVGLAGEFSAVYPRASPGGWQLIGHTDERMWNLDRDEPALVRPGDRVRFHAVRASATAGTQTESADEQIAEPTAEDARGALIIESAGLQSVIEDLGRPGRGDLGVSPAGAADTRAARQANRLVGNVPGAAVIENVMGGLRMSARGDQVLAVSGAEPESIIAGNRTEAMGKPFLLPDGQTLAIGPTRAGLRAYVAVRGGIDAPPALGSRSTDTMSGIGPDPLTDGSVLPVAEPKPGSVVGSPEPSVLAGDLLGDGPVTLRITFGPRDDWFTPKARADLLTRTWVATNQSNRIGVRLAVSDGDADDRDADGPLERANGGELPSEGVMPGSVQVPPSGLPVVFLSDHPVTGGYPVIAVVVPEDLPTAAQIPPGRCIRFEGVSS